MKIKRGVLPEAVLGRLADGKSYGIYDLVDLGRKHIPPEAAIRLYRQARESNRQQDAKYGRRSMPTLYRKRSLKDEIHFGTLKHLRHVMGYLESVGQIARAATDNRLWHITNQGRQRLNHGAMSKKPAPREKIIVSYIPGKMPKLGPRVRKELGKLKNVAGTLKNVVGRIVELNTPVFGTRKEMEEALKEELDVIYRKTRRRKVSDTRIHEVCVEIYQKQGWWDQEQDRPSESRHPHSLQQLLRKVADVVGVEDTRTVHPAVVLWLGKVYRRDQIETHPWMKRISKLQRHRQ